MKAQVAKATRKQMVWESYCIIEKILPEDFLQELREETNCLNDTMPHHPDAKYQGTGVELNFDDNPLL